MIAHINHVDVNYEIYGRKDAKTVILLHGWGQKIEMMKPLGDALKKDYQVLLIDLPGHGGSREPTYVWTIYDYADMVNELALQLGIQNPVLIGHSFGGKVSIVYASKYPISKLCLLASPFQKKIQTLSWKTRTLKQLKKIPGLNHLEMYAKKHIGSADYRNASPMMREILVQHVNLDVTEEAQKIKCPTLLIWGTMDVMVPYSDAKVLEQLIPNAGLVTYEGCSHFAYLERIQQTNRVILTFLRSEE